MEDSWFVEIISNGGCRADVKTGIGNRSGSDRTGIELDVSTEEKSEINQKRSGVTIEV